MTRVRLIAAGSSLAALGLLALFLRAGSEPPGTTSAPLPTRATARVEPSRPLGPGALEGEPAATPPNESDTKRLTRIAETSADPRVIEAAFADILTTYAARSTKKPGPDADLERAIVKHVGSDRPGTARAALEAARIALMAAEPRPGVTSAIVDLSSADRPAPRRYAALGALNLLRPDRRDASVLSAFERALDAKQPELVSFALLALSQSRASLEAAPEATRTGIARRVVTLLGHYDPGVRGHALLVLSEIRQLATFEERYQAAKRALTDRDAYVRAQGAELLGRSGEPLAIHLLIEHVRDLSPARYELRGFDELDGRPGTLVHEVPGRKRVAEAVLFAVLSLSRVLDGSDPLVLTLGGPLASDALVLENAELARSWYDVRKQRIPTAPLQPSPPPGG
ncbi:MAG TPA: hypothetical protein VGK73_32990 [Polyangiaceae bacterium]